MDNLQLSHKKEKSLLIKIEGSILRLPLIGIYQVTEEQKITAVLPNPDAMPKPVTIKDIVKDINKLLPKESQIDEESLKKTIQSVIDPDKVSFELNELLYISIEDKEGKLIDSEYAFEITLDTEGAFDFSLFDLEKASLALWNTTRDEELERMGINEVMKLISV